MPIVMADYLREWSSCAVDMFDRVSDVVSRDRVARIADGIGDDATSEECDAAHDAITEIVRAEYVTPGRLADAIASIVRDYDADGVAEECELSTPAECVDYARNVLVLPGRRAIGGYPIDYAGTESDAAYVVVVVASSDAIDAALGR